MLKSRIPGEIEVAQLPLEVTPAQVKQMLDDQQPLLLVDVREQMEHQICRIEGAELIPMNSVPQRLQYLDGVADEKLLVVHCHHGMRSLNVVNWLRGQGVENCVSMAGGIDLWSTQVDAGVPRY
jgi:rhodanese-related sulfurtransferase